MMYDDDNWDILAYISGLPTNGEWCSENQAISFRLGQTWTCDQSMATPAAHHTHTHIIQEGEDGGDECGGGE